MTTDWRAESLAAQALGWIDLKTGAISPPIHMSSTFLRDPDNQYRTGHSYIRDDNPSFEQVEALLTRARGRRRAWSLRLRHGRGDLGVPGAQAR